jgi:hypothetical protein
MNASRKFAPGIDPERLPKSKGAGACLIASDGRQWEPEVHASDATSMPISML